MWKNIILALLLCLVLAAALLQAHENFIRSVNHNTPGRTSAVTYRNGNSLSFKYDSPAARLKWQMCALVSRPSYYHHR